MPPNDAGMALDVQGLDALRRTVRASPQAGLKAASRQFEALFMQMMLKSMREATPGEHVLGGQAEKFYTGMLDQQLGQSLAGRGLGLAEAMQRQLMRHLPEPSPAPSAAPTAPAAVRPAEPEPALPPAAYERITAAATWSRSALAPAHVERFMAQHLGAAQRASERSGVPAPLILAQAALESGWGRKEPRGSAGEPSFNLFGIKADASWRGPSVEATTTEVIEGQLRLTRARFRAYASYEDAFADHARFLASQPRYAGVLQASNVQGAAQALQRAGYATDPNYAAKLQQLLRQMS